MLHLMFVIRTDGAKSGLYLVSTACPSGVEATGGLKLVDGKGSVEGVDAMLGAPRLRVGKLFHGLEWIEAAGTQEAPDGREI